ncbi:hypothetical protein MLD38_011436 [Melastoma candidum]|uniref:Uncharacterized protein n=1 Tax=Melastoma candidum TaxID=119954 RepID=A0ACB9R331_9MYRT|nr:hypothetical protein MLD38_011436 [Melastoma candidum]
MVYYTGDLRFHLAALEDELRKIQVFRRELPICYEVITQTIEAWKQKLVEKDGEIECNPASSEDDRTSSDRPVFEEFMPLRDDARGDDDRRGTKRDMDSEVRKKKEWLRSAQLWNPIPDLNSPEDDVDDKDDDTPPVVPEKRSSPATKAMGVNPSGSSQSEPARGGDHKASGKPLSTLSGSSSSKYIEGRMAGKGEEKNHAASSHRKQRRCWSTELHRQFLNALQDLGGPYVATPKQIKELMKVDGLTNDEIKSHLQKYRLHTRRSPVAQNDTTTSTPQLVVVGGIWVPPTDFVAASGSEPPPPKSKMYSPMVTIPTRRQADMEHPKPTPAISSLGRTIMAA